jgi:uncharacterized protein (TIGR02118 family)
MIIRSGLIRKRDDVDFTEFSEHWRHVHGPLALQVAAMRAYRQNHILARRPSPQAARLHRVDGISQLWFDDIGSMRVAMDSAEQRACVDDLHRFLNGVTIVVQQQGDTRQRGSTSRLPAKFVYLLGGPDAALKAMDEELFAVLAAYWESMALRTNRVIIEDYWADPAVPLGHQVVDAVLEVWLPEGANDDAMQSALAANIDINVIGAFQVDELTLKALQR